MTTTTSYISEFDAWLPDSKAVSDLRRIVEIDAGGCIEYDSGPQKVPPTADYEVVSKALIKQPKEIGFGSCFRVVVAIGGRIKDGTGIVKSKFGFATSWYDINGSLITTDFTKDTPI